MKICIIGTSHASCLFAAWNSISDDYPDVSISFYFTGGGYFDKFHAVKEKRVLSITDQTIRERFVQLSGGNGNIELDDFDLCIIVGGFFYLPIGRMSELGALADTRYSRQVIESAAHDLFARIHANGLLKEIRNISKIPILLIHDPFQTLKAGQPVEKMVNPFENYDYKRGMELLNETVLKPQGAEILLQPSETIEAPYFSDIKFALGKRKATQAEMDAGHIGEFVADNHHLNVNYGKLRLKILLGEVGMHSKIISK